jgi:quercetin dioxygenase-like cupin family protein
MRWSVRSAGDVEAKRIDESWGSLRWLASKPLGNAGGVTVGRVLIKRGCSNPRHSHPGCEEVLYLLKGRLRHTMGDREAILDAGDVVVIDAGVPHNAFSIGDDDADMIVAYSSGTRDFKAEK